MYVGIWSLRRFSDWAGQGFIVQSLAGRVHISVNIPRRVSAKLAVQNVIIWSFSILHLYQSLVFVIA